MEMYFSVLTYMYYSCSIFLLIDQLSDSLNIIFTYLPIIYNLQYNWYYINIYNSRILSLLSTLTISILSYFFSFSSKSQLFYSSILMFTSINHPSYYIYANFYVFQSYFVFEIYFNSIILIH